MQVALNTGQGRLNGSRWKRAISLLLPFSLCASILICQELKAGSHTLSGAPLDPEARSQDILAHLNAVIRLYRASLQPIQKAGEPNDVIYRDQAIAIAAEVARFAFESSRAEASLLAQYQLQTTEGQKSDGVTEHDRMQQTETNVEKQIEDLRTRQADVQKQIATARSKNRAALQAEKNQIEGSLELSNAMKDALQKIVDMAAMTSDSGLAGNIDRLQNSVPELQGKTRTAPPQLTSIDSAGSAGITSQGMLLLDLLQTSHDLDALLRSSDALHKQAMNLRSPLTAALRSLITQGQQLPQQSGAAPAPSSSASTRAATAPTNAATVVTGYKAITTEFKALSAAAVPLSQEIIALEQSRANIKAWQASLNREYAGILHALLLRVLVIVIALALIFGGGELWTRVTNQYVHEIRRRRQLLLVRRTVVGFLSAVVILFGFVTQFNSLATFAGFITAGIAVGLQTILLSVAAYFFIIGRYGVKVGDRITIATVTGDVIDVGLVRFYMMELAGSGSELHPTGRVAVFSNAVLFQAATPLYKQIPGTEYAWRELLVKLTDGANYQLVCEAVMKQVQTVFEGYRLEIERQHRGVEAQMQTSIGPPTLESRLQSNGGALQLWARFPVLIRQASETDEKVMRALTDLIARDPDVKNAVAAPPSIQASVRG